MVVGSLFQFIYKRKPFTISGNSSIGSGCCCICCVMICGNGIGIDIVSGVGGVGVVVSICIGGYTIRYCSMLVSGVGGSSVGISSSISISEFFIIISITN